MMHYGINLLLDVKGTRSLHEPLPSTVYWALFWRSSGTLALNKGRNGKVKSNSHAQALPSRSSYLPSKCPHKPYMQKLHNTDGMSHLNDSVCIVQ